MFVAPPQTMAPPTFSVIFWTSAAGDLLTSLLLKFWLDIAGLPKGMISCLRGWDADFVGDKAFADAMATLRGKVEARCAQDAAAARAAVKPVAHTLQITPK